MKVYCQQSFSSGRKLPRITLRLHLSHNHLAAHVGQHLSGQTTLPSLALIFIDSTRSRSNLPSA